MINNRNTHESNASKKEPCEASHEEYVSPVEAILDADNTDNIFLYDETGEKTEFEQIAVVHLEEHLCVILKPVVKLPGMGDNEALVFVIEERDNEEYLYVSEDNELIDAVFAQYYEMLRNAGVDIS